MLDVTEQETDKILATLDPLAAMAEMDSERITSLLATVQTSSEAVRELLKRTVGDRLWEIVHPANFAEIEISTDRAEALRREVERREWPALASRTASDCVWRLPRQGFGRASLDRHFAVTANDME